MSKTFDVAVVGATGAVGEAMLSILAERAFPVGRIQALASSRSAGSNVRFGDRELRVEDLADFDFSRAQIGFFSAGGSVSEVHAPKAAAAGCVVIDNTSQFRYEDDIPLVVPEVNAQAIADYTTRGIIANPNCSTIQMLVALKPIHDAVGIERINVATYQSVSGTGRLAIEELAAQSRSWAEGHTGVCEVYPRPIAFNALPHIDSFMENGYTREEMKMVWETRKIFDDPDIQVNPTAVRIPVFYGHSEALHIETREKISEVAVRDLLSKAPGVTLMDERRPGGYATARTEGAGSDAVYVSRVREDISHPRGIDLWVVSDNIRKGAALNSIQIAEILIQRYL
jgi:aspartate-semialdehyde dehydrogenase